MYKIYKQIIYFNEQKKSTQNVKFQQLFNSENWWQSNDSENTKMGEKKQKASRKNKELLLNLICFSRLILGIKNHIEYFWAFIKTW